MNAHSGGDRPGGDQPRLTALFIDFDNLYISLLSKDKKAAIRFATDPAAWTSALLDGMLSTQSIAAGAAGVSTPKRRKLIARVYGNPVLKNRDKASFAYIRNHFMQAGYEVIDCPPLTNQLKNGSDIRMVLDMRDLLDHQPLIDEFIIMSGDSDFVPILLRLRARNRRTMIYAGLQTAKSYTALADEIVTDEALISFLKNSSPRLAAKPPSPVAGVPMDPLDAARLEIIEEVARIVEASDKPVSMELLATSVRNAVGLKRTIDTKWAGHGQFSMLLAQALSREFEVSSKAPFMVWHKKLHKQPDSEQDNGKQDNIKQSNSLAQTDNEAKAGRKNAPKPAKGKKVERKKRTGDGASAMAEAKKSSVKTVIDNILQITDIPPLSARYYQRLFHLIADEVSENGFVFAKTASNTAKRGEQIKLPVDPAHVQLILHRIRRHGHWFSEKDTAPVLAKAFRDSVIAECLGDGLKLTGTQLDMIDNWFIPENNSKPQAADQTKNESEDLSEVEIISA